MSREIEQSNAAFLQTLAEFADRLLHLLRRRIGAHDDVEAVRTQCVAHGFSVARCIVANRACMIAVRAVADHQRDTRRLRIVLLQCGRRA